MIVKTCKTHGDLSIEHAYSVNVSGATYWRCRECTRANSRKYISNNREGNRESARKYRDKMRDVPEYKAKTKMHNKNSRLKFVANNKERIKAEEQTKRDNLDDRYIKRLLIKNTKLNCVDVNIQALIDIKRVELTIKRKIKDEKH